MKKTLIIISFMMMLAGGCTQQGGEEIHPQWIRNAVIYEVNTRQITTEGTFNAFADMLPGLKELGVDVLWFMPIYPIGMEGRKGTLGSYYSIRDYGAVNPEFGTLEDFKLLVDKAHELGMKVILDWVAAHTSRDAVWLDQQDWYIRRPDGEPEFLYDWSDVARLNYNNQEMRQAMLDKMLFWVEEVNVDGFRCDMADLTPVDFWNWAVPVLKEHKPGIFMLAESENPINTREAFNAYYAWRFHHTMNSVARGEKVADSLRKDLNSMNTEFGPHAIPLLFTSNHDENSWSGTEFERMGDAALQMAAFTFVLPGIPLIYTGQEVGNIKRLQFFEKDTLQPSDPDSFMEFYKNLIKLKKSSDALQVPPYGGILQEVPHTAASSVFAFIREKAGSKVLAIFNFDSQPVSFRFTGNLADGTYTDWNDQTLFNVTPDYNWDMEPYGFRILTSQ
ncbi:MAG TPA: alpha-amylase family glycosyl hydrolase [Bacteroidales bacterium]|jgi:glycosidase|nr:alpha-glucosidase C-terminal domain-containing protein [Bacteroidales bacterium]OQC56837.1 MAG: Cyclomaltodextrinase [Bacteroidetes bacterium ADurb.Bin013]MBV6456459.1 Cyclomaltodextrinase [Bacteroidales bacterium]MCZ2316720.1 alpha-glucosidase C-terminal domain-containing protein [Bacteroidales bacterium]NLZ08540.1 alpha-amylase [Bacteroidales bacterium]